MQVNVKVDMTLKTTGLLVPPAVVTVIFSGPAVALPGIAHVPVICVAVTVVTVMLGSLTVVAPGMKFVPVRVTGIVVP